MVALNGRAWMGMMKMMMGSIGGRACVDRNDDDDDGNKTGRIYC